MLLTLLPGVRLLLLPFPFPASVFPYLQGGEAVVLQKWQACDRDQQELEAKGVVLAVKRFPEFHVDHIHGDVGTNQKYYLWERREIARSYLQLKRGWLSQKSGVVNALPVLPHGLTSAADTAAVRKSLLHHENLTFESLWGTLWRAWLGDSFMLIILLYKDTQAWFRASCSVLVALNMAQLTYWLWQGVFLVNGGTVAPKEVSLSTLPGWKTQWLCTLTWEPTASWGEPLLLHCPLLTFITVL